MPGSVVTDAQVGGQRRVLATSSTPGGQSRAGRWTRARTGNQHQSCRSLVFPAVRGEAEIDVGAAPANIQLDYLPGLAEAGQDSKP